MIALFLLAGAISCPASTICLTVAELQSAILDDANRLERSLAESMARNGQPGHLRLARPQNIRDVTCEASSSQPAPAVRCRLTADYMGKAEQRVAELVRDNGEWHARDVRSPDARPVLSPLRGSDRKSD